MRAQRSLLTHLVRGVKEGFLEEVVFRLKSEILRASMVAQTVKNLPVNQENLIHSLDREDPLKKGMATHSSILGWASLWLS